MWQGKIHLLLQYFHAVESVGASQEEIKMALNYLISTMLELRIVAKTEYFVHDRQAESLAELHDYQRPAIHLAVKYGKLDDLRVLLAEGHDRSVLDVNGQTALHIAASEGNVEMIKALITNESDLKNSIDQSPLRLAARYDHREAIVMLMSYRYTLLSRDSCGNTPLLLAALGGHYEIIDILLELDSALFSNDVISEEMSRAAANQGHVKVVQSLMIAALKVRLKVEHKDFAYYRRKSEGPDKREMPFEAKDVDDSLKRRKIHHDDDDFSGYESFESASTIEPPRLSKSINDQSPVTMGGTRKWKQRERAN